MAERGTRKHRFVHVFQKYVANPPVKAMLSGGIAPPGYALLETKGRKTGQPRRTPVGNGLDKGTNTFWIVAEHGRRAGYVKNIQNDPRVRIKVGRRWRTGTAHLMPEDDPRARQRGLPKMNAAVVRAMGTELLTVRVDLDG